MVEYTNANCDRQLFLDTLVEFYAKLGDRKFWSNQKMQDIAIAALAQDFLRTEHGDNLETDTVSYQAAILEYNMRSKYML